MRSAIDDILSELANLIRENRFEEMESDTLEIKPVPPDGGQWRERHKSVNAFLNTRGGILILGIKEEGQGNARQYVFTGYQEQAENKIKELSTLFTDSKERKMSLDACFPPPEIRPFLDGRIALVFVDELPPDEKFCFYLDKEDKKYKAYKRVLTGDHILSEQEKEAQEEFKQEMWQARELKPVLNASLDDLDLDKLNEYIQLLNRTVKVETIKADMAAAVPFLERKCFLLKGVVTTLGVLVCGRHPGDLLGFRCQLHGYVDMPGTIAQDKQDFTDNVLPLMENGLSYVLRNIQVGVSAAFGGRASPQYPELLLRETINNALAHRDYSIDRQVIVAIKPGVHISISNPGRFRQNLLIETRNHAIQTLRIVPEAKPRNPRLADVLRVYRKWEGRGIGMATLVNLCLQDEIDIPYYRLHQDEVRLFVCAGHLLDSVMDRLFTSFDAYIMRKLDGSELTRPQKLVMAYLIKSELANRQEQHTIMLTADNNHYLEIRTLEQAGLIEKHPDSPPFYPIFIASRELMKENYNAELREMFDETYDTLNQISKDCLNVLYRHQNYSRLTALNAKQVGRFLWVQQGKSDDDIRGFDNFARKVRYFFNRLTDSGILLKQPGRAGYRLDVNYRQSHLL